MKLRDFARDSLCRPQKYGCAPGRLASQNPEFSKRLHDLWTVRDLQIREFLDQFISRASASNMSPGVELKCGVNFVLDRENKLLAFEFNGTSGSSDFNDSCIQSLQRLHLETSILWPDGTQYEREKMTHYFSYPNTWTQKYGKGSGKPAQK